MLLPHNSASADHKTCVTGDHLPFQFLPSSCRPIQGRVIALSDLLRGAVKAGSTLWSAGSGKGEVNW